MWLTSFDSGGGTICAGSEARRGPLFRNSNAAAADAAGADGDDADADDDDDDDDDDHDDVISFCTFFCDGNGCQWLSTAHPAH